MNLSNILSGLRMTFSKTRYIIIALGVAILFFLGNVLIKNSASMKAIYQVQGISGLSTYTLTLVIGFPQTVEVSSFISLIVTSLLLGILLSIFLFKVKATSTGTGLLSTLGVAISLLIPGCAACGIGVAAFLGLSGTALSFLPLGGLEFSILAILLLSMAVLISAERVASCEMPLRRRK